jgi:hypothetical protein
VALSDRAAELKASTPLPFFEDLRKALVEVREPDPAEIKSQPQR